jgi:hypothetical protein
MGVGVGRKTLKYGLGSPERLRLRKNEHIETGPNLQSGNSDEFATVLHDPQSWPFSNQPKTSTQLLMNQVVERTTQMLTNPVVVHTAPKGIFTLQKELFDVKIEESLMLD